MTMSAPTPQVQRTIELPAPGYPMVTRMISDPLFPPEVPGARDEPVTWVVSQPHPLVPDMKVVRMFEEGARVVIYSVSADGQTGMRNFIPMARTRLVEEAMPLEIFIDELAVSESGEDDDPPDDSPEASPQDSSPEDGRALGPQAVPTPDDTPPSAVAESTPDGQPEPTS